jgi:anti-sigma factor RsiW
MTQIDPAELSGLLDGELPPARAAGLRAAIAADPALHAAFEALAKDDAKWRRAATAAQFVPALTLPARKALDSVAILAGVLLALVAVRVVSRLPDALAWELAAQAITLCAALAWIIHLALAADEA